MSASLGIGGSVAAAPLCGLFARRCHHGRFGLARGSFERRYNIRLHQTAPRELCLHSGRATPRDRDQDSRLGMFIVEYTSTIRAIRALPCRWAVWHGLSGRAAPLVNRSR